LSATAALLLLSPLHSATAKGLALDVYTADAQGIGVTSTLIYGDHEAILVDTQFRNSDAERLAARIAATGRHLKAIVITHPHFDHYFGAAVLLQHFPGTPVYLSAGEVEYVKATLPNTLALLRPRFGSELPAEVTIPQPLPGTHFLVDGEAVDVIPDLQGDVGPKPGNNVVWVPSLAAAIVGDIVFENVHLSVGATNADSRKAWQESLHRVAELHPRIVVPGHKKGASDPNDPHSLEFNAAYLTGVDEALKMAHTRAEYIAEMSRRFPDAGLSVILVNTATRLFPNETK
jgi:glyoxylase-like metal-dependent hydrolase (beta-lactamase superfamily II)